jgi:hypothetical protein
MDSSSTGLSYQSSQKKSTTMNEAHRKKLHWIAKAIKHPGALHKSLGVPAGQKIPEAKLEHAAAGSGVNAKRARLAETLKKLRK